jgi:hypothetical protein
MHVRRASCGSARPLNCGVMRGRPAPLWFAGSLLAAAFDGNVFAQESCSSPVEWQRMDEGDFSLELPSSVLRVAARGDDSQVGAFESKSMRVAYDYGFYLLWLGDDLQRPGPHQRSALVGGRNAIIVFSPRDFGGRDEYRFAQAVQFELPPAEGSTRKRFLTVTVRFNESCDAARAQRIVESILFE